MEFTYKVSGVSKAAVTVAENEWPYVLSTISLNRQEDEWVPPDGTLPPQELEIECGFDTGEQATIGQTVRVSIDLDLTPPP